MPWFGIRTLYKHNDKSRSAGKTLFEERIVLFTCTTIDEAILRAEQEADNYCRELGGSATFLNLTQAFAIFDNATPPEDGSEVFSLMRDSELNPDDYLDAFFDTGAERQK